MVITASQTSSYLQPNSLDEILFRLEMKLESCLLRFRNISTICYHDYRGGSRISHWGAPTLVGGGTNLRHRRFSVKTYVKMKEFGPVGGGDGRAPETFACRSATALQAKDISHEYDSCIRECTTFGSFFFIPRPDN